MRTSTVSPTSRKGLEFLAWVAHRPRSYAELMAAWSSTCPRQTVWEDAIGDGLIQLEDGAGRRVEEIIVTLTPRGHARLAEG